MDYRISLYYTTFGQVVERAVQLDRTGKIWSPNPEIDPNDLSLPSFLEAQAILHSTDYKSIKNLCDLNISLIPSEKEPTLHVSGTLISYLPLRYVSVLYGPVPNLEPFLGKNIDADLVGPIPRFGETELKYNAKGYLINGWDIRLCCTNLVRDSCCESSVIAWVDEQTEHTDLQNPELARV